MQINLLKLIISVTNTVSKEILHIKAGQGWSQRDALNMAAKMKTWVLQHPCLHTRVYSKMLLQQECGLHNAIIKVPTSLSSLSYL
jgi:phage-related protein